MNLHEPKYFYNKVGIAVTKNLSEVKPIIWWVKVTMIQQVHLAAMMLAPMHLKMTQTRLKNTVSSQGNLRLNV